MKSRNKDHKPHESIIGKIIYGFLLFMPLLAIGVTCAYAIFNKNAYQSYYGEHVNEVNYYECTANQMVENNIYTWTHNSMQTEDTGTDNSILYYITNVKVNNEDRDYNYFKIYHGSNNAYYAILLYTNGSSSIQQEILSTATTSLSFQFVNHAGTASKDYGDKVLFQYAVYEQLSFVSEVFYYSIDKVQQSPLFNWAEDSAIYTGMTATCTTLNITTPFIPLLMTYWLIISVIYILYDIILVILHIFHKKIHQLEDSF